MRRPVKNKPIINPDLVYDSVKVTKFTNYIMLKGKKNTARRVVNNTFNIIKEKSGGEPLEVFETALKNTSPNMELTPLVQKKECQWSKNLPRK